MVWKIDDPQGNEAAKVRHLIVPYTRGKGLDLGCGPFKAWPHFIGVDNFDEYKGYVDPATGQHWAPEIRADVTDLSMFADNSLNFVFSSHLLEHLDDTEAVLKEWWRVVEVGGHLVLYLPHKGLYPNIGEDGANPDHKRDFMPSDIVAIMELLGGWDLVWDQERDGGTEYSFLQVFKKLKGSRRAFSYLKRVTDRRKTCLIVRYGGWGDMLQASSIFPALKAEGYRVTVNVTPRALEAIKEDPRVDEFMVQDVDQVPNEGLGEYWAALYKEYDRAINLSEATEGTLLALPGRRTHALSQAARHMHMDLNYVEFIHAMADVPFEPSIKFYPTTTERRDARKLVDKLRPAPLILWALAGSSVHKKYPWFANVAVWLLQKTDARIIFVGDRETQILEFALAQECAQIFLGYEYEKTHRMKLSELLLELKAHFGAARLICKCGALGIRQSLALAQQVDVVVGPETGVLNAVSMEESIAKVVMLSHSSHENLTRDWPNTKTLAADVPCYPCHRMHYDTDYCPQDPETGASVCAAALKPSAVYEAITECLGAHHDDEVRRADRGSAARGVDQELGNQRARAV